MSKCHVASTIYVQYKHWIYGGDDKSLDLVDQGLAPLTGGVLQQRHPVNMVRNVLV